MPNKPVSPIILTILDGWGYSNNIKGNAIKLAATPHIDKLWNNYPHTLLSASGKNVGLPEQQMGNSEVGHTTIGAGRSINQDLVRISQSIKDRSFFNKKIFYNIFNQAQINNSKIHLIGLCSDGGVHSHISHLVALIDIAKQYKDVQTCIHIITDGRDTKPNVAKIFIKNIMQHIDDYTNINICTISGRYYSMDRDCRWTRTEKAYNILINNQLNTIKDPLLVIDHNYKNGIFDEFILPTRIHEGAINHTDGIIFFNFRPDRIRQILHAFAKISFKGFPIIVLKNLNIITFTQYDIKLKVEIVFPPQQKNNFLGEIVSNNNLKQFRLAETEKYAHVTYFFNGGREEPFPGEDRELIPSPKVKTYDLAPEMSAYKLTDSVIKAIQRKEYNLIVINYANPDMVGHTGNLNATIEAISIVDTCIGTLVEQVKKIKGTMIITADHGNAEYMLDQENKPCTSHSTNLVPFILMHHKNTKTYLTDQKYTSKHLNQNGSLTDIAPTILDILNIKIPADMNGSSLINKSIKTILTKNLYTYK